MNKINYNINELCHHFLTNIIKEIDSQKESDHDISIDERLELISFFIEREVNKNNIRKVVGELEKARK